MNRFSIALLSLVAALAAAPPAHPQTPAPAKTSTPAATPAAKTPAPKKTATPAKSPAAGPGVKLAPAASPTPRRMPLDIPSTHTQQLDVRTLLADPLPRTPELLYLQDRRISLARQDGKASRYTAVAFEFESRGAFFPAVELLWFARIISQDEAERKTLNAKMQALVEKSGAVNADIEPARQMRAAGRFDAARTALKATLQRYPFSEMAYYELGLVAHKEYVAHEGKPEDPLQPLDDRVAAFRECFESFRFALAIDPMLEDAYYQLNVIRDMLPDQRAFLQRSEIFTRGAVAFRSDVAPRVQALEQDKRSAQLLDELSKYLVDVGSPIYAVYAAQAALAQPDATEDMKEDLQLRIDSLRALFPKPR